jgi:large subunit ribosomal protein L19
MDVSSLIDIKKNVKIPDIAPGDTVRVNTKIVEGDKERIQVFQGVVIKIRHGGNGAAYTVRHIAYGVGVERTFPMNSPLVEKVEVVRHGKVRRSRLYYLRGLSGKEARRKIKRVEKSIRQVGEELLQEQPEEEIEPIMDEKAVAAAEAAAAEKETAEAAKETAAEKAPEKPKKEKKEVVAEKPVEKAPKKKKEEVTAEKPEIKAPEVKKGEVTSEEPTVKEPEMKKEEAEEKPAEPAQENKEENPQS